MSSYKLNTLEDCQHFVDTQTSTVIVDQILEDQKQCRNGGIPSLVVHCLPRHTDNFARAVSGDNVPLALARMRFASIISSVKAYLVNISNSRSPAPIPDHMMPTDIDLTAALKVLTYLQLPHTDICLDPSTPLETVADVVKSQLSMGPDLRDAIHQQRREKAQKFCYICRYLITSSHPLYPSLCIPCGDFNISSSSLSLPPALGLTGRTALVTGGRVNLGYHTALRLLRCGASVIVSSRYPKDAETRYMAESDSDVWKERLRIIGADFRAAKDVFSLIKCVVDCLQGWSLDDKPKLHILINNAAQTLTDALEQEEAGIRRELHLTSASTGGVLLHSDYLPRVRGGIVRPEMESSHRALPPLSFENPTKTSGKLIASRPQEATSSWTQRISEIPYEDVISAHSVNTFVPFILIRELLPFMFGIRSSFQGQHIGDAGRSRPAAYIVNVSSREGISESKPGSGAKAGHHVHTNMSKA
ncbi:hypothetical protein CVT26_006446, partial [Gymnopilus dilepis]